MSPRWSLSGLLCLKFSCGLFTWYTPILSVFSPQCISLIWPNNGTEVPWGLTILVDSRSVIVRPSAGTLRIFVNEGLQGVINQVSKVGVRFSDIVIWQFPIEKFVKSDFIWC